jgi:hypothetical protein
MVRTVLWQYWFTDLATIQNRRLVATRKIGPFSPSVTRGSDGPPVVNQLLPQSRARADGCGFVLEGLLRFDFSQIR